MLERWLNRQKVHAIHERDIESILKDLGLYDKICAGEISCSICGEKMAVGDVACIFMEGDEIRLCCSRKARCEVGLAKR